MNAVLGLLYEEEPREVLQVGEEGQRQQPEGAVGDQPGGRLQATQATPVVQHQVAVAVLRAFAGGHLRHVGQGLADVLDPALVRFGMICRQCVHDV